MDRGAWRVTVQGVADHKRSEHDLSTKQQQRINKRDSPLRDALALSPCEDRVRRRMPGRVPSLEPNYAGNLTLVQALEL